jgi:hypothetical protein
MNTRKISQLTIIVSFLIGCITTQGAFNAYAVDPTGSITVSPNPAAEEQDLQLLIAGQKFDTFALIIAEDTFIFSVDKNSCSIISSERVFSNFSCSITEESTEKWSAQMNYTRNLVKGQHTATLSAPNSSGTIASESFTVGNTSSPTNNRLTVSLSPTGPLQNNTSHALSITWNAEQGKNYIVTTTISGLDTLPLVTDCNTTCSTTMQVPQNAPAGNHTITVTQEGNASINGSARLEITSSTVDRPLPTTPPPTATPVPPPCGEALDAKGKCPTFTTAIGNIQTDPADFITNLLSLLLSISGGIALIIIIYAGYRLMISKGDPEAIQNAKDHITSAVIGLLFLIFSLTILEILGVDILQLPGFTK